ncbi:MAG TPA: hypothetical protein VH394_24335 [Thermoanaerobaculia bacterium]|jgi:hypothetical protein|nr:hypothetical protein [Thermoanaerobaculia bacterium]
MPEYFPYVFLIPIAGIMLRFFKEWLRFKAQHRQLGSSTEHLEKTVAELRAREQELTHRLENLEAIVVSQTWDAVHDRSLPPVEKELRVASAAHREMAPPPVPDSQKAEALARRLRA